MQKRTLLLSLASLLALPSAVRAHSYKHGAIAIGHPLGMSGARILGHLVRTMPSVGARHGAAALCIGVGQGLAVVVESV